MHAGRFALRKTNYPGYTHQAFGVYRREIPNGPNLIILILSH